MAANELPVPSWLLTHLRVWQRRLDLQDWNFKVGYSKVVRVDGESVKAFTNWTQDSHEGLMEFSQAMEKMTGYERQRLIVHELYHILANAEDDILAEMVGRPDSVVYKKYSREQELLADKFASIMLKAYGVK